MANNSTNFSALPREILLPSIIFKFIAMIIGVLGNIAVIIYTIFWSKEKTATSYLVGNLALADLLLCLTFYPIWSIKFIQIMLNIDSDQDLFCKLSRSTIRALLFASVAMLLAITVDRYLYIVKPLKYPLIVTKRRVFAVISGIWLTACCLFIVLLVYFRRFVGTRLTCYLDDILFYFSLDFTTYLSLTLIIILNVRILIVAQKQRKRILAETLVAVNTGAEPAKKMTRINRFLRAHKAVKTFSIVVAVLTLCVLTPTVVRTVVVNFCSRSCRQMWLAVFHYEFYGINSIVNAFIYGMRHIRYRKAYGHLLFKILRCNKPTN